MEIQSEATCWGFFFVPPGDRSKCSKVHSDPKETRTPGEREDSTKVVIANWRIHFNGRVPVVLYKLDIEVKETADGSNKYSPKKWCVFRRYNNFVFLLRELQEHMKKNKLEEEMRELETTQMPKKILFGNLNKHLLADRMAKLNALLQNITSIPKLLQSAPFQNFISKESDYEYLGYSICVNENAPPIQDPKAAKNKASLSKSDSSASYEAKGVDDVENEKLFKQFLQQFCHCGICNTDYDTEPEKLFSLEGCKHTFCVACLKKKYPEDQIDVTKLFCPFAECTTPLPLQIVMTIISSEKYDKLLKEHVMRIVESSTEFIRCPNSECEYVIERIPLDKNSQEYRNAISKKIIGPDGKPLSVLAITHRLEYRFRCRACLKDFCACCKSIPYHEGFTCDEYERRAKSIKCRFCDNIVKKQIGNEQYPVCDDRACREKSRISCTNKLACGHWCIGVRGEKNCPPCLNENCSTSQQNCTDLCNMCWIEELGSAPCLQLECGHVFHYDCIITTIKKGYPGPRITFNFICCPLCKVEMSHPALQHALAPVKALREDIQKRALNRLRFESLEKDPEIISPKGKYYQNPLGFAMDKLSYFMCYQCKRPYFAGLRVCDDGQSYNPEELVCGGCSGRDLIASCKRHGTEFVEFKCQFCCSVASWFCWGKTHFCDACHTRQLNKDYLTRKHPSEIPRCPGKDKCPLRVDHPHCQEFCLGCLICRSETM